MNYDEFADSCHPCSKNKPGIVGESLDISLKGGCNPEIKADIVVAEFQSVRIWGQIKNAQDCPVPRVLLKLLRCECAKLIGVAHTISDCQGFYQFDLCDQSAQGAYKILAGRPVCLEPPCASSPCCESCLDPPTGTLRNDCAHRCKPPKCSHGGKSALCKTCAYYDEERGLCCLACQQ